MKTTTQIVDEEYESLRERAYIEAERYEMESLLMQEVFEQDQHVKVVIGKERKRIKSLHHARVTTTVKTPRFIRIQSNNRRVQTAPHFWDRFEPPICTGMPF